MISPIYIKIVSFICLIKTQIDFILFEFKDLTASSDIKHSNWSASDVSKFCRYIEKISNFLGIKSCFIKSLTKRKFLKNKGFDCKLYIGISNESVFKSHCWLICEEINCYEEPEEDLKIIRIID